jgi:prepilin-type N-terminal cleavage/methylation domain-containing protein
MLISSSMNNQSPSPKNSQTIIKSQKGFTLIEVLIAMFLVVMVFTVASTANFTSRQTLEETLTNFERAVRFAVDETALRNVIIRIHFKLDSNPQEYAIEYGPDDSFVLPTPKFSDLESLSLRDKEVLDKATANLNRNFNKLKDYSEASVKISDDIRIVGVGNSQLDKLQDEYQFSIYIYPTGEKDGATLVLGSDEEIVSISINPFTSEFKRVYKSLPQDIEEAELFDTQYDLAQEIFQEWKKN